jgi:hypothetical protein
MLHQQQDVVRDLARHALTTEVSLKLQHLSIRSVAKILYYQS